MSYLALSRSDDAQDRCMAASDKRCHLRVLRRLSFDNNPNVRECVAKHRKADLEILSRLSQDIWFVRSAVALNARCPREIWMNIVNDEDLDVVYIIARAENCSEEILEVLSRHKNWSVRYRVANHRRCKVEWIKANLKGYERDWFLGNENYELRIGVNKVFDMYSEM
jgi:hypothetical protein